VGSNPAGRTHFNKKIQWIDCVLGVSGSNPRHKNKGFDDAAAAAIARQGDPEGARCAAPSNPAGRTQIQKLVATSLLVSNHKNARTHDKQNEGSTTPQRRRSPARATPKGKQRNPASLQRTRSVLWAMLPAQQPRAAR
jgi:hypothetical protein